MALCLNRMPKDLLGYEDFFYPIFLNFEKRSILNLKLCVGRFIPLDDRKSSIIEGLR